MRRTKLKLRDEANEQSGTHLTESACLQRHRGWKKEDLQVVEQRKTIGRFDADDQQRHSYPDPYHWHHCHNEIPASQKKTQMTLPFLLYKHTQVTTRAPIQQTCSEGSLHNHQTIWPVLRALYNIEPCLRHGRFQSHLGSLPPEDMTIVDHAVYDIFYSINLPLLMYKIIKIIEVVAMMAAVIGQLLSLLGLVWLTWQKWTWPRKQNWHWWQGLREAYKKG